MALEFFGMPTKKPNRATYIREWRKHRKMTLEQVARQIGMTTSNLSKTERGENAYTQPVLEALAEVLRCSPADLITRRPGEKNELQALFEALDAEQRDTALTVIKALKDRSKAA